MKVDSLNFIKRLNIFSVLFLISFGILLNVSASSVEGLNLYGDNFAMTEYTINIILGGIKIPKHPPEQITPEANFLS